MSDMVEEVIARTQVMFEDLKRDIGMLADGHLMLGEKIDALAVRLDGRIDRVDGRLERIEGHLGFRGTGRGRRPPARRTTRPRRR